MSDQTIPDSSVPIALQGCYLDKKEALASLGRMGIAWSKRQIDWTAEPDHLGNRRWPWFLDDKGVLRIDSGFIHRHFEAKQLEALRRWREGPYTE